MTLRFLGSIESSRVDDISTAIDPVARTTKPFVCAVQGLGSFPNPQAPRVLWVGLNGAEFELAQLVLELDEALAALGFSRDERSFQPHLTLARIRADRRKIGMALGAVGDFGEPRDYGTLSIDHVTLFQSEQSDSGSVYRVLATLPILGMD